MNSDDRFTLWVLALLVSPFLAMAIGAAVALVIEALR